MSTMRIGGLASGMDIDTLVEKLMQAERAPLDKLEQQKQTYEWQRDAYRDVNTKLKTFDTYIADNFVLKTFNTKTATTSNSNYVTATATSSASGSLSIEGVSQLASAARGVGSQVNGTGTMKLDDLFKNSNVTISDNFIEIRAIQADGTLAAKATKIEFTTDMTVNQFVSKINSSTAGVNAVFENGRLSITAKNTGDVKGDKEIVVDSGQDVFKAFGFADGSNLVSQEGKNAIFQVNGIATERSTNTFSISGYSVTLKDTFNGSALVNNYLNSAQTEYDNAEKEYTQKLADSTSADTAFSSAKTAFESKYNDIFTSLLNSTEQQTYGTFNNPNFFSNLEDGDITKIVELLTINETQTSDEIYASINSLDMSEDLKKKLTSLTKEQLLLLDTMSSEDITTFRQTANELSSNYNTLGTSFLKDLSSEDITAISNIDYSKENPYEGLSDKITALSDSQKQVLKSLSQSSSTPAEYELTLSEYNQAAKLQVDYDEKKLLKEQANNELTLSETRKNNASATLESAKQQAANPPATSTISPVTLTSTSDIEDMVTKIKEFVTTYNGLITDLTKITNETKNRDYKPLTTVQRNEMEEKEIELWETKAKSGLLKGDSIIKDGLSSMRSLIYQSNPAVSNPKYNTLYNIGITTSSNYLSGGTLEIDENKLRAALQEDPDAVATLFRNTAGKEKDTVLVDGVEKEADTRGFMQKLRASIDTVNLNIEGRAGRSTMVETQYTLGKYLKNVNNSIDTWQDKLTTIEDRYWRQFSAMESMINKANSQSASLSSYFAQ